MLHNHLRNFTSHKLAVHFYAPDKPDDCTDGVYQFSSGVEIRTHHRGGFVDARDAVSLRESGGGCGDDKCRGEDCFSVFKMFLFINCSCFLPSKGWMVLCRAVDTLFLYFGFSGCPFVSTDVGVSVADGDAPCVSSPRGLMSFFHVHFFYCCHT